MHPLRSSLPTKDVLNRLRYDLLSAESFSVLLDNAERPQVCRTFLLHGSCHYGRRLLHRDVHDDAMR